MHSKESVFVDYENVPKTISKPFLVQFKIIAKTIPNVYCL